MINFLMKYLNRANVVEEYWKFLHCDPTYLGYVNFSIPKLSKLKSTR